MTTTKPAVGYIVCAVATGEFRSPRKCEWLLSGSYIEAYQAENNLAAAYRIAKLA